MDRRSNGLSFVILVAVAAGGFALAHLLWRAGPPPFGAPSGRLTFLRTPVELIGLLLLLAIGVVEIAAASRDETDRARLRFHVLALAVLGTGLVFWVMMNTNRLPAPQYLIAAAAVVCVLLACAMFVPFRFNDVRRGMAWDVRYLLTRRTTVLGLIAAIAVLAGRPATASRGPTPISEVMAWYDSQPRVALETQKPGTVTILEFIDYQCPSCRRASNYYAGFFEGLSSEYPGRITHRIVDFPLDGECSHVDAKHPAACEAAIAVRLARRAGREDRMVAWLWASQQRLTSEGVATAVQQILGINDFAARYAAELEHVKQDIALAARAGVRGTPAYVVNGVVLGMTPKRHFEAIIEAELNRR